MTICKQRISPTLPIPAAALALLCAGLILVLALFPAMQVPALAYGGASALIPTPAAYPNAPLVAHAMGQIDDRTGTNSLEAFQANYAKGYRLFECDLAMTSDSRVVLRHDWSAGVQEGVDPEHIPTAEEFQQIPIYGQYTSLTFLDLLGLLALYPEVYFILDGKDTDAESVTAQYTAMVEEAEAWGMLHLFDRLIVQLYAPEMQDTVEAVHHFDHYMLTLYQTPFYGEADLLAQYAAACEERGIQDIVMWHFLYSADFIPLLEGSGIRVWLHTVNDASQANRYLSEGAWGIYSDRIDPAEVNRI